MSDTMKQVLAKVSKKKASTKGSKKRRNTQPARARYWDMQRLRTRKVRNLMLHCGLTKAEALVRWDSTRRTRAKGLRHATAA